MMRGYSDFHTGGLPAREGGQPSRHPRSILASRWTFWKVKCAKASSMSACVAIRFEFEDLGAGLLGVVGANDAGNRAPPAGSLAVAWRC
jgi:hypothetical protein